MAVILLTKRVAVSDKSKLLDAEDEILGAVIDVTLPWVLQPPVLYGLYRLERRIVKIAPDKRFRIEISFIVIVRQEQNIRIAFDKKLLCQRLSIFQSHRRRDLPDGGGITALPEEPFDVVVDLPLFFADFR